MKTLKILLLPAIFSILLHRSHAQQKDLPPGWHLLDHGTHGFYGISLDKALDFVSQKKLRSKPVIVAVIDTGIDTTHPSLNPVLWRNAREIPANGIDDDKNGYTDDISGWNFLGSKDGALNVEKDSDIELRIYYRFKSRWEGKQVDVNSLSAEETQNYRTWKKASDIITGSRDASLKELAFLYKAFDKFRINDSIIRIAIDKEIYTGNELSEYLPNTDEAKTAKKFILNTLTQNNALSSTNDEFLSGYRQYLVNEEAKITNNYAEPPRYRDDIVKDNYFDINDRFYGNNNIMVSSRSAIHGSYVAGIIGAVNQPGKGFRSVAGNVKILFIRATDEGSEHEKDIASAIRYAVENGARIINMSFGNPLSVEKKWVDEAVKFAAANNVLIVHASSNSAANYDLNRFYPDPEMMDGSFAANWITVGSSSDYSTGNMVAGFSSYGKKSIDVFAPGVKIVAPVPGNGFQSFQGSSTAAAVVSGLAAFLLQYYPDLSAVQVKSIIENSVAVPARPAKKPGSTELVALGELCRTGGIVNAYNAIRLAARTTPAGKNRKPE